MCEILVRLRADGIHVGTSTEMIFQRSHLEDRSIQGRLAEIDVDLWIHLNTMRTVHIIISQSRIHDLTTAGQSD